MSQLVGMVHRFPLEIQTDWMNDFILFHHANHNAKNKNLTKYFHYRYDPKTDTWTTVSSLSVPRDAVGICLLGDRLYAVGGYDGQSYLNTVESYDAQNNEWTEVINQLINI